VATWRRAKNGHPPGANFAMKIKPLSVAHLLNESRYTSMRASFESCESRRQTAPQYRAPTIQAVGTTSPRRRLNPKRKDDHVQLGDEHER